MPLQSVAQPRTRRLRAPSSPKPARAPDILTLCELFDVHDQSTAELDELCKHKAFFQKFARLGLKHIKSEPTDDVSITLCTSRIAAALMCMRQSSFFITLALRRFGAMVRRVQSFIRRAMAMSRVNKQRILVWWTAGEQKRQFQAKTKMQDLLKRRERASSKEGRQVKARLNKLVAECMDYAVPEHIKKQTIDYFYLLRRQQYKLKWVGWRHRRAAIQMAVAGIRERQMAIMQKLQSQPDSPQAQRWSAEFRELQNQFDMLQQDRLALGPEPKFSFRPVDCSLYFLMERAQGVELDVGMLRPCSLKDEVSKMLVELGVSEETVTKTWKSLHNVTFTDDAPTSAPATNPPDCEPDPDPTPVPDPTPGPAPCTEDTGQPNVPPPVHQVDGPADELLWMLEGGWDSGDQPPMARAHSSSELIHMVPKKRVITSGQRPHSAGSALSVRQRGMGSLLQKVKTTPHPASQLLEVSLSTSTSPRAGASPILRHRRFLTPSPQPRPLPSPEEDPMPDSSTTHPKQNPSPNPSHVLAPSPVICRSVSPRGLPGEWSLGGEQGGGIDQITSVTSTASPDPNNDQHGPDPICPKPHPKAVPRKRVSSMGQARYTHNSCRQGPGQPVARQLKVKSSAARFQGDKSFLSSCGVITYDQLWTPQTDIFGNLCTPSVPVITNNDQGSESADTINQFDAPTSPRIESLLPDTSKEKGEIQQMSASSFCTHSLDASLLSTLPSIEEAGLRPILPAATSISHRFFAARSRLKPERKQDSHDRRVAEERKKRSLACRQLSSKQHA
mmetsp:Transcript_5479/g.9750  ORF Transcript_5479/g.9750 Transcript_5479/m.9750 type:complete len:786 (-) Transcript_5479:618-2975(-)